MSLVRVWRADLDFEDSSLAAALTDDERARAARFHFERDRRRYVAARGILHRLLGPATIAYRESGKPYALDCATRFNVSHSGGVGLFALSDEREIGVDVELGERLGDDLSALARRIFSAAEFTAWDTLLPAEKRPAFLDGWTRKEALLKGKGAGIARGMRDIDAAGWQTFDLREFAGAAACLAVRGEEPLQIERFEWSL